MIPDLPLILFGFLISLVCTTIGFTEEKKIFGSISLILGLLLFGWWFTAMATLSPHIVYEEKVPIQNVNNIQFFTYIRNDFVYTRQVSDVFNNLKHVNSKNIVVRRINNKSLGFILCGFTSEEYELD